MPTGESSAGGLGLPSRRAEPAVDSMERVTRARLGLMLAHPFLASAVARLPLVDATGAGWCPTAATDGYYVYVNLAFAATLDDADLGFVLAHEVLHCVLGHPDRLGPRERMRWNVAIDYATNALLAEAGFTPPARGLYDRRYAGMTAEAIYDELDEEEVEAIRAQMQALGSSVPNGGRGQAGCGAGSRPGSRRNRAEEPGSALRVERETSESTHPGNTAGFDVHLDPGDLEGSPQRAREFPSAEERQRLRAELAQGISDKLAGTAAGYWAAELEAGTERAVPWRELLARFVSGLRRSDYRLFPPHRKHLWRGLYLPSVGVPGPEHLVVAVDTSGSMSGTELAQILGEIDGLRSAFECRVTVIQCDVAIHRIDEHDPWDALQVPTGATPGRHVVHGRGGTDLRPPFAWVADRAEREGVLPDALIYCTDGYGPFPREAPDALPVLWIVTETGVPTVPFGELVRLPRAASAQRAGWSSRR